MDFNGRTVLVTGSNRGIGRALVEALPKRGVARIYATARDMASLPDFGDARVVPLALDVTDQAQVDRAALNAPDVDLLINNAGAINYEAALDGSIDDMRHIMEVNHWGTLRMMRAFAPMLESRGNGAIVNLLSVTSLVGVPIHAGYSASKAAAWSMTQCVRIELSRRNVAVHGVYPGPVDTDMAKGLPLDAADLGATVEEILDGLVADVPDIQPDAFARDMFALWQQDYRQIEAVASGVFHGEP
jgi:NAD(P)-dependent dehydrogenase (short-subunit alcohol dehydrogenase family)